MSFDRKKRDKIKKYILEKIGGGNTDYVKRAMGAFDITSTTVYRYLKEMENEGILEKSGSKYHLKTSFYDLTLNRSAGELKNEDKIYIDFMRDIISDMPENVRMIWQYSFTEMMNNAIEHSDADKAELTIGNNYLNTFVIIYDDGVGIFRKIKEFLDLDTLEDAARELFKGKFTTDSSRHTGEGIFFTSRMLDDFAAVSEGVIFTHDKYSEIINDLENIKSFEKWRDYKGTIIYMNLSNQSKRKIKEVFDKYADVDEGFTKTYIRIKNMFDTYPVSRSQARRLVNGLEKYEAVQLDFKGVDDMGQGFGDELFRVFALGHPEVRLEPLNMNEDVEKMYRHVIRGKSGK